MKSTAAFMRGLVPVAVSGLLLSVSAAAAQGRPDLVWLGGGHGGLGGTSTVALSPDEQTFASCSFGDYTIKLWRTSDSTLIRTIGGAYVGVNDIAFSPDGASIYSVNDWLPGFVDSTLKRWNVSDGTLLRGFNSNANYNLLSIALSPDGTIVAGGGSDFKVRLWNTSTGALLRTLSGHTNAVESVAFSPDGLTLASGSTDNNVKLWTVATGALQRTLTGHTFFVMSVAWSPDSTHLVSGSFDATLRVWEAATGVNNLTINVGAENPVDAVAWSHDGSTIASGGGDADGIGRIRLWDAASGALKDTLDGHLAAAWSLKFNATDTKLYSCGADNLSHVWDTSGGDLVQTFGHHTGPVVDVAYSHDSAYLASISTDLTAKLWDARTGADLRTFVGHIDLINAVSIAPDNSLLATAAGSGPFTPDPFVRLWDLATGQQTLVLDGHEDGSTAVDFSPDSQLVASGGRDHNLKIWSASTGDLLRTLTGHTAEITDLVYGVDGSRIYSAAADATVRVWDAESGALLKTITNPTFNAVRSLAISPDERFAAGATDGYGDNLVLFDLTNGTIARTFAGDPFGFMQGVSYSSDGQTIASSSGYTWQIQLWNAADGTLRQSFDEETGWGPAPYLPLAYAPDGSQLGYGRGDGTVAMARNPFACPADLDGNGVIDLTDLASLLANYGCSGSCTGDLDHNGVVDLTDLAGLLAVYGSTCG